MLNKRILSFLLAVVLVVGLMPTSVFASETEGTTAPSESVPETTGEAVVLTDDGEGEEGDPAPVWCELCQVNDCGKTHTQCEACGTWDCETEHKYCEKCEKYDCGKSHVVCEICKVEDCGVEHEQCEACGTWDCEKTHTQCEVCDAWDCTEHKPCDLCGAYDCNDEHEYCEICKIWNCDQVHGIPCMICGKTDCGVTHIKCGTCGKYDCEEHKVTEPTEPEGTEGETEPTVPEEDEEEKTLFEQLMEAESVEDMYIVVLDYMENDPQTLMALTAEEIADLKDRINELDPEGDDADTADLLDTLAVLPNGDEEEDVPPAVTLVEDTSGFTEGMTQIFDIEDRVFYLILNRNTYGVMDTITSNTSYTSVLARNDNSTMATYAAATKELDAADLTKWLFESTGTSGEFYVKGLTSGKYMKFNEGQAALVDKGVPTKVYAYTVEDENEKGTATYVTLYAFIQENASGTAYVLNQLGGASFNGFGGWTDDNAYTNDTGNLFLMKEAYYEAESDIRVVPNSTTMNATIKVFNYDASVNDANADFKFLQGSGYGSKLHITPAQAGAVDGISPEGATSKMATMSPVLGADGYPNSDFGSFKYLFEEGSKYHEGTMDNGGYLFQQKNNYYVYDSIDNAAWYDKSNNRFVLYDLAISPTYAQTQYLDINVLTTKESEEAIGKGKGIETHASDTQSGNFLPFNQITESTAYNEGLKQASGQPRYSLRHDTLTDLWFGLTTEFDFYMPENGKKNGTDMIFDFTGDDDVWVYIDDVLILDIGGTHAAYNGSINFATGEVKYKNSNNTDGVTTNLKAIYQAVANDPSVDANVKAKVQDILDNGFDGNTFKDFTRHSFNFYYLERGGNISYCRLKYNMDPLPKGALTVEKKTTNINSVYNDGVYEFTITGKDGNNQDITYPFEYQIVGKDGSTDGVTHKTSNGKFTLTDGQTAIFVNIEAGNQVNVAETGDTLKFASECTVTGSAKPTGGTNASSGNMTFDHGDSHFEVVFTNTIISNDLTIDKVLDNPENAPVSESELSYTFQVKIKDAPYTGMVKIGETSVQADAEGKFTMLATQTAVIENIPKGLSYVVTEDKPEDTEIFSYDDPTYSNNSSGTLNADTTVTVTNTIHLRFADLTITKTGIDNLDHHGTNASGKEERQSTVYTITGTTSAGVAITPIKVVISGNTSVTIKSLPLGRYTVTEDTGWSWRYGVDTISAEKDTDEVINGNSVTFDLTWENETVNYKNKRDKIYWLSGDSYCENNWGTTKDLKAN